MFPEPGNTMESREARHQRLALLVSLALLAGDGVVVSVTYSLARRAGPGPLVLETFIVAGFGVVAVASLLLSWRQRPVPAMRLLILGFLATVAAMVLPVSGLGIALALIAVAMASTIATLTLPPPQATRFSLLGFFVGVFIVLYDLFGPADRAPAPPLLQTAIPMVGGAIVALYGVFIIRQFNQYSLRAKLIIGFLTVSLVPLLVLAIFNNRFTRAHLVDGANSALRAAAIETADNLDAFFRANLQAVGAEATLSAFSRYLTLPAGQRPGSPEELEVLDLLFALQNKERVVSSGPLGGATNILSYDLLDGQGRVALSTDARQNGQSRAQAGYVRAALDSPEPVSSPVEFRPEDTLGHLYFAARILGPGMAPVGVLVLHYDAAVLQQAIEENNNLAGEASFGVLFDENALHLAHGTVPDTLFRLTAPVSLSQARDLQAAGRLPLKPLEQLSVNLPELAEQLANSDAQPLFTAVDVATGAAVNRVAAAPLRAQPWQVAFFQPQGNFLGAADTQTRLTAVLAVVIALIVMGGAVLVSRQLSGPLVRLTRVAEAITAGDLYARARPETGDEIGTLAATFNGMAGRLQQTLASLEQRVAERTAQLQAAADIGRATTSIRDLGELLQRALQLVRERFGYYHVSIFLMDAAGEFAVLRESTGEVGALLIARGHRLARGSRSLIGWVTENRRPRAALDTAGDPFHFKNPLLPETRSELAIPLLVGDRLLGALDVQSREANAFDENTIQVLQTLADLLSVAIENAVLFERTQANLEEMNALVGQVTGSGWRSLLSRQPDQAVYELMPGAPPAGRPVEVPLRLRGQVVGVIELQGRDPQTLTVEEQAVLETAAAQLAVALESAALLEEVQRRSRREQLLAQITDQIGASLHPATIAQTGIRELGKALGASEVVIQLHAPSGGAPAAEG